MLMQQQPNFYLSVLPSEHVQKFYLGANLFQYTKNVKCESDKVLFVKSVENVNF